MKTTIEELLAFVAVVDAGSLTAAAEQLDQTTSGISRALSRLEEKLDTTLLRRTTRRLELSEEGAFFLVRAREILAAMEDTEEQMTLRRQKLAGTLRVDAASPFILHVVVPLVRAFHARYPDILLEFSSNDQIADLIEHRTDLAIRIGALRDSTLRARSLGSSQVRLLASPAYLAAHGKPATLDDLARHTLLGFTQPEGLNRWPVRDTQGDALVVAPAIRASSGETLRQLALSGNGIVCLSDFMTHRDIAEQRLIPVLADITYEQRQPIHAVYYRNTALSARIVAFLDFLSEHVGTWPGAPVQSTPLVSQPHEPTEPSEARPPTRPDPL